MDKPTAPPDADNRQHVLRLVREFNGDGKAIVIATHDPYLVDACQRVIDLG